MITDAAKVLLSFSVPALPRFFTPADAQILTLFGVSRLVTIEQEQLALAKQSAQNGGGTASTVTVDNFPSSYPVTGNVTVDNFPATQPISGSVTVSNFPATQPVSAASLPLPTGAATETTLSALNAKVTACNTNAVTLSTGAATIGAVTQSGTWNITNVSGTISLPTGASTETTLSTLNAKVTACNTGAVVIASSASLPMYRVAATAATYQAAVAALTVAASATDIFTITGSASKTVTITKLTITATRTTGAQTLIQIIKRSAANSGGTSTNPTAIPYDSTSAAATATVAAYTANPTPGAAVGTLYAANYYIAGTGTATTPIVFDFGTTLGKPITLRSASEVLAVNLNGVTITGGSFNIAVEWEEA